jgi:hypothetical protein
LSTATITSQVRRSATSRAIFCGPTIWLAIRMSAKPAAAITSASPSLAQVNPMAPASVSLRAICGTLMPLVCGRQLMP